MTYKDWLSEWLEHYKKPSTKDKTYSRYEQIVQLHLIPKEPLNKSEQQFAKSKFCKFF